MGKLRKEWLVAGAVLGLALPLTEAQSRASGAEKPRPHAGARERSPAATPLSARERVEQILDRFTYGPRPGEIDRVLAEGGSAWFEQQLNPAAIPDPVLSRRLGEFPALALSPQQALGLFPDRQQVKAVADGREPLPNNPLQRAVMEVQLTKLDDRAEKKQEAEKRQDSVGKLASPKGVATAEKGEAGANAALKTTPERFAEEDGPESRQVKRETAARVAGTLLAMPREQRMATIIALPVRERIALTGNGDLPPTERQLLVNEFTPQEREAFVAMGSGINSSGAIGVELAQARVLRDILSERQLEAVMTDLWFNHFNVSLDKGPDHWYTASYEREAIRPHALGKFGDLLVATATSPAMMVYLDNLESVGPESQANGGNRPAGKKGPRGLNENYGREVMELHTVGVNGGYSQADVTALAAILTGWGVDQPQEGGPFAFNPKRHQPGTKAWFGHCVAEDGTVTALGSQGAAGCAAGMAPVSPTSMQQGIAALKLLAASPQTAHSVAFMLTQYFVADAPPTTLVDRVAQVYQTSGGDIKAMLRTIADSPEFNSRQYFRNKVKTPIEFLASAYRSTGTDPVNPGAIVEQAKTMGMPLYRALPPTGYYLTADQWMNSTALVDRLNFAYLLSGGKIANQPFDGSHLLAAGLLDWGSAPIGAGNRVPVEESRTKPAVMVLHDSTAGAAGSTETSLAHDAGAQFTTQLLGQVVTGQPISAKTSRLIEAQVTAGNAGTPQGAVSETGGAGQRVNLIVGLLLGSPEFQMR